MSPTSARWVRAGAAALAVAAIASLATRPRDPPLPPELPPDPRFVDAPRLPPARPLPAAPRWVDWTDAERPAPGVEVVDEVLGWGAELHAGEVAVLEATSWRADGRLFESTREQPAPIRWVVGEGALVPGLDAGLPGLRVGGERTIWLEPDAGFGGAGLPGRIPPGSGLQVEVELLDVWAPPGRLPDPPPPDLPGDGPAWDPAAAAVVDYALWSTSDPGAPLDSSLTRWYAHPLLPGRDRDPLFDRALQGLRAGGRRTVRAPAAEVLGADGRPPLAPPDAELVLTVVLRRADGVW